MKNLHGARTGGEEGQGPGAGVSQRLDQGSFFMDANAIVDVRCENWAHYNTT